MTPNEVDDTTIVSQPWGGESGAEQNTHTHKMYQSNGTIYKCTETIQIPHKLHRVNTVGIISSLEVDSPAASAWTKGDGCDMSLLPSSLTASTV